MGQVKALDHIDTGIIETRGYKLDKVFTVGASDDILDIQSQAMDYAEKLADKYEVGFRPISKGDDIYFDVYILK